MKSRLIMWAVLIVVIVGGVAGWMLYQSHQQNKAAGEQMQRQAEQLEKLRRQ